MGEECRQASIPVREVHIPPGGASTQADTPPTSPSLGLIPVCHLQPHLNKKLLSLSRNPEARVMPGGLCQTRSSAKGNRDVCWSLDSRKRAHSSPPGFSGSGPSFPLASVDPDTWPREWGPHPGPVCPVGTLGYLRPRMEGCSGPSTGWVSDA